MALSKHNIIVPVEGSDEYFIVNPLYKKADFISADELAQLKSETDIDDAFAKNGYLVDPEKEKKAFKYAYLDFVEQRDKDEVQLFFVPNYSCNFACSYCYQEGYEPVKSQLTTYVIDLFFGYIGQYFDDRKKYVTVFGGEPLLPGKHQRKLMEYFVDLSLEKGIELAFVTNGYTLTEYLDLLKRARIREVQVTLDGTAEIHDNRRYLHGQKPTFHKIVEGIDACLEAGIPINLRVVVDKDNIDNLPALADFAISRGWTKSPLFKTQLGRNYELHVCNSSPDKLFDRATLYKHLYHLLKEFPQIAEFHRPAFSISRYIADTGQLPVPLFDSCPACKTEWAFDYTGNIYSCTATVGKKGEELGTFYPLVTTNDIAINEWQNRDITTIAKCKNCDVALACGGGCASVAKNNHGFVNAPDCRPVKELLSLGAAYYF
jgi:uncharacterized protein